LYCTKLEDDAHCCSAIYPPTGDATDSSNCTKSQCGVVPSWTAAGARPPRMLRALLQFAMFAKCQYCVIPHLSPDILDAGAPAQDQEDDLVHCVGDTVYAHAHLPLKMLWSRSDGVED
jgi:hypothetical protein